jgi:putative FmdB family regulatory protein
MPIYAFECASCGHEFERLQRLADADPTHCPVCGAEQVRRQLTAPSFRLAGAGWYETDFKKDGDKKRNLAEKSDASSGSSSSDAAAKSDSKTDSKSTQTETKPAAKAEPKAEPKPAAKPATPGAS